MQMKKESYCKAAVFAAIILFYTGSAVAGYPTWNLSCGRSAGMRKITPGNPAIRKFGWPADALWSNITRFISK